MSEYFDVGKMPPGTPDCIATRCINLMCALLKGIDYKTLYTEALYNKTDGGTIQRLIDNTNALPLVLQRGATEDAPIVIEKLAGSDGAFVKILAKLSQAGAPEIIPGDLFYTPRQDPPGDPLNEYRNFVVDTLESVHAKTDDQMYHFCVPFLAMQLDRTPYTTQAEFDDFIAVLGKKSLQDFYDKPYTAEEKKAAVAAQRAHIFVENRPESSAPPVPAGASRSTKGNARKCNANTCVVSQPEYWCTVVTFPDGSVACALGSD